MPQYKPSPEELDALRLLEGRGWVVLRRRTYEKQQRRLATAQNEIYFIHRESLASEQWANRSVREAVSARDRLEAVIAAAASLGVSIEAINNALAKSERRTP